MKPTPLTPKAAAAESEQLWHELEEWSKKQAHITPKEQQEKKPKDVLCIMQQALAKAQLI